MSNGQSNFVFSMNWSFFSKRVVLCLIAVIGITTLLDAQIYRNKSSRELAKEAIHTTKTNGLIVRLQTKQASIDKLNQLIASSKGEQKKAFTTKLKEIVETQTHENKQLITAFQNNYSFSDVYFVPDYNMKSYYRGDKDCFWDKDLQQVVLEDVPTKALVLGRAVNKSYDWVILDLNGKVLDDPFPNFFSLNNPLVNLKEGLFQPKSLDDSGRYIKLAGKISDKLNSFHNRVTR